MEQLSTSDADRPRLCENSVRHGRPRNDVLPKELRQYFVLARVAAHGPLRKVFPPDSRNWSFHTASALCCRSSGHHCRSAASPYRTFMAPRSIAQGPKVGSAQSMRFAKFSETVPTRSSVGRSAPRRRSSGGDNAQAQRYRGE